MIHYIAENIELPFIENEKVNRWIKKIASNYEKKIGQISYIFCSDEKILEINKQFLNHDYFTDIITFDYSTASIISGDIFISIDTVNNNAKELNISHNTELLRIMIHGILHLCGQEDKSTKQRAEMTRKENLALELLD